MKIKKGDTVEIISGKDRGKRGEVLQVMPKRQRLVVQGLNIRKKHARPQQTAAGRQTAPEIVEFEGSIHISNVMVVDPKSGEPTRVGYVRGEDGKATRVARASGEKLDR